MYSTDILSLMFEGYEDRPYVEFLKSKNLSPNVLHYILHAIAMVTEATPTTEVSKLISLC